MAAAPAGALPVLIVGAGPTGLAAAMSLARARVPVRLIDKALQPDPHSRAIGIQARTLELLEQHRLIEPFLELGHRAHAANLYSNGQRLARLDFDPLQTRYPYVLFLDQPVTEQLLGGHLAALDVEIERGVALRAFAEEGAALSVTLDHADGHTETLRAAYLIAADGAHSTVRHQLGVSFAGKTFAQTFLLADLQADTGWPDDEFQLFASADGLAALFPMGGQRYRLIADHPPLPVPEAGEAVEAAEGGGRRAPDAAGAAPPPSLDACRALVAHRIHHPVKLWDLSWSAHFHLNSRMVEQLRAGRVFLAGDAAHVHSPAGAQGMNTGIQEAFNLGWKLAAVMLGRAPERLLDTYHAERHPIERDVLRQTSFATQLAEAGRGPLKLLRERVMPALATFGPLRDAARQTVSELAIQYRRSPLTLERVLDGGPRAGERAPDALVHVLDGPLGRAPGVGCIFDLHDPAFFSLFLLVAPNGAAPLDPMMDGEPARDAALDGLSAAVERLLPGGVRIWRVTDMLGDGAPPLAEAYGRTRPAFYLVRPDGYIGVRGRPATDLHALQRHCEMWFAARAAQRAPAGPTG
jgi:3-(3-hydroxy-phenyl)propionate hydroxylase